MGPLCQPHLLSRAGLVSLAGGARFVRAVSFTARPPWLSKMWSVIFVARILLCLSQDLRVDFIGVRKSAVALGYIRNRAPLPLVVPRKKQSHHRRSPRTLSVGPLLWEQKLCLVPRMPMVASVGVIG